MPNANKIILPVFFLRWFWTSTYLKWLCGETMKCNVEIVQCFQWYWMNDSLDWENSFWLFCACVFFLSSGPFWSVLEKWSIFSHFFSRGWSEASCWRKITIEMKSNSVTESSCLRANFMSLTKFQIFNESTTFQSALFQFSLHLLRTHQSLL